MTSLTAGVNSVLLDVTNPLREDFGGLMVWASTVNGFVPGPTNLKLDHGPDFLYELANLAAGVPIYVKYCITSLVDPNDFTETSAQLTATPLAPSVNAESIFPGTIRGSHVVAGAFITKGTTTVEASGVNPLVLNVQNTVDFPAAGSAVVFSATAARDFDLFTYTGKTATSFTGCAGLTAHSANEVVIPLGKTLVIDQNVGELRIYGDNKSGGFEKLVNMGSIVLDTDGNERLAVFGSTSFAGGVMQMTCNTTAVPALSVANYGSWKGIDMQTIGAPNVAGADLRVVDGFGAKGTTFGTTAGSAGMWAESGGAAPGLLVSNTAGGPHLRFLQTMATPPATPMGSSIFMRNDSHLVGHVGSNVWKAYFMEGDLGALGGLVSAPFPTDNLNNDTINPTGIYNSGAATAGANPIAAGSLGVVLHAITGNSGMQMFVGSASGRMFIRSRAAGGWGLWKEWLDEDDMIAILGSSGQIAGTQTWTGSNSFSQRVTLSDGYLASAVNFDFQPAQTAVAAAATLTAAQLLGKLIRFTGAAATLTLDTAAALDTATGLSVVNRSFDFSVINTGAGVATLAVGTGITAIGSLAVANGDSGTFRLRRTGAGAWILYRI